MVWDNLVSEWSAEELGQISYIMSTREAWLLANVSLRIDTREFLSGCDSNSTTPLHTLLGQISGVAVE
jgi:hypothetical protein